MKLGEAVLDSRSKKKRSEKKMKKLMGKIILASFALIGVAGSFQAVFSEIYVNPALPLYVLVTVCAVGFLILSDKK